MKPVFPSKPRNPFLRLQPALVAAVVASCSVALAADLTFSSYTATGSADTSWVLTNPVTASINFGGDDVPSFGSVAWEGTRTNGHNENETYASIGGYSVYYSEPGVAWGNVSQNTYYPIDPSAAVLHDGAWRPSAGQIDIAGLTIGREYTAKLIFADSRSGIGARQITVSAMGTNTGSSGAVQYAYEDGRYLVVTATWTADAASISLSPQVAGGFGTQINAVQIVQNPLPPGSNLTWDNGASTGTWNTSDLNWSGSAWTNAVTNNAVFGATGAGPITVAGPVTVGNLTFNAPGYTISGSSLSLESSIITNSDAVTIASDVTGTGLTKAGAGELTLNGTLGYAGNTTVSGGSLVVGTGATFSALSLDSGTTVTAAANDAALTVNGDLTLHNGATLSAASTPNATFGNIHLPDLGQQVIATGDATSTISAQIHLRELRRFEVADGTAATDLLVSGRVDHIPGQAWGGLIKSGPGALELSSSNGQGGNFLEAGTLIFANNSLGNPGGPWPLAGFNGDATLRWSTGNTQDISPGGKISVADGITATLDTNGNDVTLANPIAVGASASGGIRKEGAGTLTLGAANTYAGNTEVAAGSLVLAAGSQLAFKVADGGSNLVTGTGSAAFNGAFNIDTSAVTGNSGGIWTLVDRASLDGESFGATFTVTGFADPENDGIWIRSDVKGDWSFDEASGELSLDVGSDYEDWALANGLAPGSEQADADNDGLSNEEEYAFGLLPQSGASVNPIAVPLDKATGTFRYTRRDSSLTDLTYRVWYSENLTSWTEDTGATEGVPVLNGEVETVPVTLSALPGNPLPAKLFIQVRAN
jgi:autotransporter-associated beta strand protein